MTSLAERLLEIGQTIGSELATEDRARWQPAIETAATLAAEIVADRVAGRDTSDKETDLRAQWANISVGALLVARRQLASAWRAAFQEVLGYALTLLPAA